MYEPVAFTASGRPWYRNENNKTLYWDFSCDGDSDNARWVLDSDEPSTTAEKDLDGDGACSYAGRIVSNSPRPPYGMHSWRVFDCEEEWVDAPLSLLAACPMGSGIDEAIVSVPTGMFPDAARVRIRDDHGNPPSFDALGTILGRLEVLPSGETVWGALRDDKYVHATAEVACKEMGRELGYEFVSGSIRSPGNTPDGGPCWWYETRCRGYEETLESCPHRTSSPDTGDYNALGVMCTYTESKQCEICGAGKFSDAVGPKTCFSCHAGRYGASEGSISNSSCLPCEAGEGSELGSSFCEPCDLGLFRWECARSEVTS